MCISSYEMKIEKFDDTQGASDPHSISQQTDAQTRVLLNTIMAKSLIDSASVQKTDLHLSPPCGLSSAPAIWPQSPVMDPGYFQNFLKFFNLFYPNVQKSEEPTNVTPPRLACTGDMFASLSNGISAGHLHSTEEMTKNISGFSIANLLSPNAPGNTGGLESAKNGLSMNGACNFSQYNASNGLLQNPGLTPDVVITLNNCVQNSLSSEPAGSSFGTSILNIPSSASASSPMATNSSNIPLLQHAQTLMNLKVEKTSVATGNASIAFQSSEHSPGTPSSNAASPLQQNSCCGSPSLRQSSTPTCASSTSHGASGDCVTDDWLRNLIKTAGAVIRPGKPTSYFQLRQRRDSAEITSLAKDIESRKKRFACSYPNCNKAYYKKSHLKEHSYIHTGDKPYLCSQPGCGARFTRADQLSRHRRAHTGERNFCCLVCSKRFKRSDHLKVHLARHAGQNNLDTRSLLFGQTIPK